MDQVKQVFSFCGNIVDAREGGVGKNFAFLEFSTEKEALAALALNGMNVGGRNIRAELAKTPKLLNPRSFTPSVVSAAPAAQSEHAKAAQSEAAARAAAISARLSAKGAQGDDVRYKPY
jgi:RNA recognition motif-containing protein